jgi:hypothetical protein
MHLCLKQDVIVALILSKGDLRQRFALKVLSRKWMSCSIASLMNQKSLWIMNTGSEEQKHSNDILVHSFEDLDFWKKCTSFMPRLEKLKINRFDLNYARSYQEWKSYLDLLQVLMTKYCNTLQVLLLPQHEEPDEDEPFDPDFPFVYSLPGLKIVQVADISSRNMRKLLTAAPNICLMTYSSRMQPFEKEWLPFANPNINVKYF